MKDPTNQPPNSLEKLGTFGNEPVVFVETMQVKDGVVCDVYSFVGDESKDLGVVTVFSGFKTPLQKVLGGDKTIEGFVSGAGVLVVTRQDGSIEHHSFDSSTDAKEVEVKVGEFMQWEANGDSDLVFSEVCYPPYKEGRFENISN